MITADVKDWMKSTFSDLTNCYVGRMTETNREKLLLIRRGTSIRQHTAIGGLSNTSYSRIACNCILHWNKNAKQTEVKAKEIHDFLLSCGHPNINGYNVVQINIRNFLDIGSDENDIYEYAIDFEVIYQRHSTLESEE